MHHTDKLEVIVEVRLTHTQKLYIYMYIYIKLVTTLNNEMLMMKNRQINSRSM